MKAKEFVKQVIDAVDPEPQLLKFRQTMMALVFVVSLLGVFDAGYLTLEHYSGEIPPCSTSIWVDCGKVLKSQYAMIGPIPLAVLGLMFYSFMLGLAFLRLAIERQPTIRDRIWSLLSRYSRGSDWELRGILFGLQLVMASTALFFSAYLVYLQLGVIGSICLYCMFSALLSTTLFLLTMLEWWKVR